MPSASSPAADESKTIEVINSCASIGFCAFTQLDVSKNTIVAVYPAEQESAEVLLAREEAYEKAVVLLHVCYQAREHYTYTHTHGNRVKKGLISS